MCEQSLFGKPVKIFMSYKIVSGGEVFDIVIMETSLWEEVLRQFTFSP